ncbi:MAG: hypothetical protein LBH59_00830 [Planctomycetaceae bacterium]|nr:hypothetical protein [Planctomycetaceae bacterium]
MNKRFAMLCLPCSALRILKRLQHTIKAILKFTKQNTASVAPFNVHSLA